MKLKTAIEVIRRHTEDRLGANGKRLNYQTINKALLIAHTAMMELDEALEEGVYAKGKFHDEYVRTNVCDELKQLNCK